MIKNKRDRNLQISTSILRIANEYVYLILANFQLEISNAEYQLTNEITRILSSLTFPRQKRKNLFSFVSIVVPNSLISHLEQISLSFANNERTNIRWKRSIVALQIFQINKITYDEYPHVELKLPVFYVNFNVTNRE
ncbi:hypothetical protein WN51_02331 [Melipona quadrifasciata]|uniref:Uncharacterized protein n=1 Tax=Melipona quadrifasciata TaxID=166423 RepID=A0A0N0BEE2_9HYME|nr:hypothetical protein WN51_02331 [Melipona quadrifasciata]